MKHRVGNKQAAGILPMSRQPAILPRVGRLVDYIGALLALASRPLRRLQWIYKLPLPRIAAKLASMWYLVAPANLLWPTLAPAKIKATLYKESRDVWIWADKEHEALLWQNGSFGKGVLSRADATWLGRYKQALGAAKQLFIEDLTAKRRERRQDGSGRLGSMGSVDVCAGEAGRMEPVQLWPLDALFLSELGCLECAAGGQLLSHAELWQAVAESSLYSTAEELATKYAAYFSFRARGWTVKPGIKFGADFLLYGRGGPARSHSRYAAIASARHGAEPWQHMFALSRVCAQARKPLVVCYVDLAGTDLRRPPDLAQLRMQEFLVERFNPNRK
ncbi:tRNA splicing endonuclease subunit sen2 [Coemansia sp. RSA 989]|nr:tRNA splicing endonuclease subunit sen2 [Coemansia sp. RSA 1086]KAJ1751946.1 tRNA splicing endonuclease subunit sen2 [Coemansia sp. RSA 1821]KAJ1866605.1 tRNA splicing endonuclease subunit sen2 [Coemansia sp. RSA 989]KAJ2632917.1 tRNA splicing endonuclease subunit sen2 [Coemansia sp. RSA 1290]KAJ2648459.1 tRNA splicing endonuclease subunit sen2 [Coemansia sp. RSA 1250]